MEEKVLLDRCIAADRNAQAELYKQLYPQLMSICRRYEHNDIDARGLLNQGFLKILLNLKKRKEQVPFTLWCRKVMINTIISEFRKNKKRIQMETNPQDPSSEMQGVSQNAIEQFIETEALQEMLDKVPEMSRKVFNLFAIDGYSHNEIAKLLGISSGTSKWHVSHARKSLKSSIERFMVHDVIKNDQ